MDLLEEIKNMPDVNTISSCLPGGSDRKKGKIMAVTDHEKRSN